VVEGETYRRENDHSIVRTLAVTPGFFSTFGVRVTRGRPIAAADRKSFAGVAIVSESFARRLFHNADPIGRRIRLDLEPSAPWLTIIGVMPTLISTNFNDPQPAEVLTSFWQERRFDTAALAVSGSAEASNAATLRKVVASIDPDIPLYATESMSDVIRQPMRFFQIFGTLFDVFGIIALVLSSVGLYAVMTFSVSRRIREIGIRLALGASAGKVIRMICGQGAWQICIGMAIGFLFGFALVRVAGAVLFQMRPNDPFVMTLVAAVLVGTASVACLIPARRATRVDPVVALRME
jgi:putative ABC transport system permease protein